MVLINTLKFLSTELFRIPEANGVVFELARWMWTRKIPAFFPSHFTLNRAMPYYLRTESQGCHIYTACMRRVFPLCFAQLMAGYCPPGLLLLLYTRLFSMALSSRAMNRDHRFTRVLTHRIGDLQALDDLQLPAEQLVLRQRVASFKELRIQLVEEPDQSMRRTVDFLQAPPRRTA